MEDNRKELIVNGRGEQEKGAVLSDEVVIEIIHAFRDIMIEFLNKRYQKGGISKWKKKK